jgi:hypothetical protein
MTTPDPHPTAGLQIVSATPHDRAWATVTAACPWTTAYQHRGPLLAAATPDGFRPLVFIARVDGVPVGGIAAVADDRRQVFPRSVAAYNGPLVAPDATRQTGIAHDVVARRLVEHLAAHLRHTHLRLVPGSFDVRGLVADGWQPTFTFTWHVDVRDPARAWRGFDADRRRLVRRAERLGYTYERLTDLDRDTGPRDAGPFDTGPFDTGTGDRLAALHTGQQARYGIPPDIAGDGWRVLLPELVRSGDIELHVARTAHGEIAAFVALAPAHADDVGGTAAIIASGADPATIDDGPTSLVRWHLIGHLAEHGTAHLDLNGARPGPVGRFKASFGGRLVERWELVAPRPRRQRPGAAWFHRRRWRRS